MSETYRVRAQQGAEAWLNAWIATSNEENRGPLYRTISVEFYRSGVQFISSDGHMLFRTWVRHSDAGDLLGAQPDWIEAPEDSVVVRDADKFANAFMRTLLTAADEIAELTFSIERADDEEEPALGDEVAKYVLVLHALGQQLSCALYDGAFPDWRALQFSLDPIDRVDGVVLAPKLFAAVGKLRGVYGVECEFRGDDKAIAFVAKGADVRGLLMPKVEEEEEEPELAGVEG
jgi:hypothetical protein